MINKLLLSFFILLNVPIGYSQEIKGVVLDTKTKEPIESASIYYDNTTIGTTTNKNGAFSIPYQVHIKSPLIVSFLGYQKIIITNYSPSKSYKIEMMEDINTLDKVIITDDGIPRKLKLKLFKQQFLGFSENSQSCSILNEDDIILRYFKNEKQLTASSKNPIVVENKKLQYRILFDINDFKVDYSYVNIEEKRFTPILAMYLGTLRFENLEKSEKKRIIRNRQKAYTGSTLHFMRALSKKQLIEEGYQIFRKGFMVNPYDYFKVTTQSNNSNVSVQLKEKVDILFNKKQSLIESQVDTFSIDQFGNHTPIDKVIFSGFMGNQILGDALPLDYKINDD